ncbi:hypothetical protein ACTACD_14235 [Pseudomonas syringae]|uniref:hypothetical protein n=1 Tax=Pseudomonas syringae TaxID=317 RepID=UPI003F777590
MHFSVDLGTISTEAQFVRDQELRELQSKIADDLSILDRLEKLAESDFALIGKLIQLYAVIDMNSRIVIRLLRMISDGLDDTFADKLNETDVIIQLKKYANKLKTQENLRQGIDRAIETLDMHRQHRHTLAHWVVKRMPEEDAFVILTKSSGDLKKRGLNAPDSNMYTWGVFKISHLREELNIIVGHCNYISQAAHYLYQNFDHVKSAECLALSSQ